MKEPLGRRTINELKRAVHYLGLQSVIPVIAG